MADVARPPANRFRLALALVVVLIGGCELSSALVQVEEPEPVWKLSGPTMGTRYAISVVGGSEFEANTLRDRIDQRLALVNRRMSTYDPESEISRFNSDESTTWFAVSSETQSVVAYALELASDSGGAFDPTVGPLVNLWGFGPDKRRAEPPTEDEITAAQSQIGFSLIESRPDPPAIKKNAAAAYLDLSAVAKGYGVDVIAQLIEGEGYSSYLVEIGGEVRAKGAKPNGQPWRIGVEKADPGQSPTANQRPLQQVIELSDMAMATSGDYRNFFEHEGERYSHTIDPTTGRPVSHDLATVTVLAETCMQADALATALLVMGPHAGYDWASERGIAALMVSRDERDRLTERTTPAWQRALDDQSTDGSPER